MSIMLTRSTRKQLDEMLQKSGQVGPFGGQKTIKLPKTNLEDVVTIYNGELKEFYCYWKLERYEKRFTIKDCCRAMELKTS